MCAKERGGAVKPASGNDLPLSLRASGPSQRKGVPKLRLKAEEPSAKTGKDEQQGENGGRVLIEGRRWKGQRQKGVVCYG